mmetsp:Transcript_31638/g.48391  ORF Transcript_31638/g.48391 Transcript_31638/m.48391 type:complete len:95 (-) Transcript_31638:1252-1536(-)
MKSREIERHMLKKLEWAHNYDQASQNTMLGHTELPMNTSELSRDYLKSPNTLKRNSALQPSVDSFDLSTSRGTKRTGKRIDVQKMLRDSMDNAM